MSTASLLLVGAALGMIFDVIYSYIIGLLLTRFQYQLRGFKRSILYFIVIVVPIMIILAVAKLIS